MARGLTSVTLTALVVLAVLMAATSARSLGDDANATKAPPKRKPFCKGPCGWVVYTPIERKIDHYVRNSSCQCAPGKKCLKNIDDISISAYIYECLDPETRESS